MDPIHLDLTVEATTESLLRAGATKVLSVVRPDWDLEHVHWKVFTDGITNKLIGGWLEGNREDIVLVRVYGEGTETIIDRQAEMLNMQTMQNNSCGSKLYAVFNNGICYEFLQGEILSQEKLYEPQVWTLVARMMARLHQMPLKEDEKKDPCLWRRLRKFIDCCDPNCRPRLAKEFPSKNELLHEVSKLERRLENCQDEVVFCHNDVIRTNVILQCDKACLIDLEYAAPNYATFDIANHFCEFVGAEGVLDYQTWLPTKEWQLEWIMEYLSTREKGSKVTHKEAEVLQTRVEHFMLAAHLLWAVWAVIQANNSTIQFDFQDYALQRLKEFKRWKTVLGVD